jgi:penicillin-binding protein 1A
VAQRLGIQSPLEPNRSLPLGTSEVTLYEMTRAFAAFANRGNRVDPYVIMDVKTADGTILYEYHAPPPITVMNQQSLEQMNQMLYEVIQTGTGQRGDLGDRPAAAKTGTSQDWHDAWFVGYTADFVTGVWVGNDDNSSMKKVVGGSIPASIWKAYMIAAHRNVPVHSLPGIDVFGDSDAYANADNPESQDNPWVERDENGNPRGHDSRDRGVIEEFFDSLFGGRDSGNEEPPESPDPPQMYERLSPRADATRNFSPSLAPHGPPPTETMVAPRPSEPAEAEPGEQPGPYRQPESDPDEGSPF